MNLHDDTPEPGHFPAVYPKEPPRNLLPPDALTPSNLYAFEGIDACGKSSIIAAVAQYFRGRGRVVHVRKLGGSELIRHAMERTKWINADPVCFNLLNWVSLFEQTGALRDQYNGDALVFFDRYAWTVKIRGRLEGLASDWVDHMMAGLPLPRSTFLIDCPVEAAMERIGGSARAISYFEAGIRDVEHAGDPMIETNSATRTPHFDRKAAGERHLSRMRGMYAQYAASLRTMTVVPNTGALADAVAAVIASIEADLS